MNTFIRILCMGIAIFIAGCGMSGKGTGKIFQYSRPSQERAVVYHYRLPSVVGNGQDLILYMNNTLVTAIKNGGYLRQNLAPGTYTYEIKRMIGNQIYQIRERKNTFTLVVNPDKSYFLRWNVSLMKNEHLEFVTKETGVSELEGLRAFKKYCIRNADSIALLKAADQGKFDTVKHMVDKGHCVDTKLKDGQTALMISAFRGYTRIVKYLIEAGADVNAARKDVHATALHASIQGNQPEITALLLHHHADVNALFKNEKTPLMMAVQQNNFKMVKLLMESGADYDKKNKSGISVLGFSQFSTPRIANYISKFILDDKNRDVKQVQLKDKTLIPPQANPVYHFFNALENGDPNRFQSVFSPRIRLRYYKKGMHYHFNNRLKNMDQYRQSILGNDSSRFDDLSYAYKGSENEGIVQILLNGMIKGKILVFKENETWKIDENF